MEIIGLLNEVEFYCFQFKGNEKKFKFQGFFAYFYSGFRGC